MGQKTLRSIHPQGWVPIETALRRLLAPMLSGVRSIHPQGWVPIETIVRRSAAATVRRLQVAFTPKGGCPLKPDGTPGSHRSSSASSIHPQGWVPIETSASSCEKMMSSIKVAFTPKGGCPLKPRRVPLRCRCRSWRSIHPQGWVPIETDTRNRMNHAVFIRSSIHPQGWVPIET